jgi:glycosyltransferase involved in cell wall biosynthesis
VKLVAVGEAADHVCCRYRLLAFAPVLAHAGYTLDILPFPDTTWGRLTLGRQVRAADAVILQRRLLSDFELGRLRGGAKKLIFDFDDAVWLRDSYSPKGFDDRRRAGRFRATVAAADLIVAGNDYLADHARRFTGKPVVVIPTCVDPDRYPAAAHAETRNVRLVWVGSRSTLRGLDRFRAVLEEIGRGVPGVSLRLICDDFLKFDNLLVEKCVWSEATEAADIAACDIGLSWVPDDPWSRGKCGLKILQYMAAGLPVVTNSVGVHIEMVKPHRTGTLADDPHEWVTAVRTLASQPLTRRVYGQAARQRVRDDYSVTVGALAWLAALQQLLKPRGA